MQTQNSTSRTRFVLLLLVLLGVRASSLAQTTAFTYQGRLNDAGGPANGLYDLKFAIYNAATAGAPQGNAVTNGALSVSNGLFGVTLDFGAGVFTGSARWLEIAVRTNGDAGGFQTLSPRQQLTSTPYAISAAAANSVAAANIVGPISLTQLPATLVTNGESSVALSGNFTGTVSGNGGALTSLNANNITTGTLADERLSASVATLGGFQFFTGGKVLTNALNSFAGHGARLTGLNAANITSGTLDDRRLSANVATLGGFQFFTGGKVLTNAFNSFAGHGAGLTGLNATNITSGTLADGRLSANVATLGGLQFFTGGKILTNALNTFAGHGAGLTGLNATNIVNGTLADARLSANVATLAGIQIFSGAKFMTNRDNILSAASIKITDDNVVEFGSGIAKQVNAGKIGYQALSSNAMDIVGAGMGTSDRKIKFWSEGGATFNGALGVGTDPPAYGLNVSGNIIASGTVTGSSDRNVKERFEPVDVGEMLARVVALPIQRWNYIGESTPHVGPMAQDFHAAFGVGLNNKTISMVDADGVALAAIQGLHHKMEQKEAEIAGLKKRLEKLERILTDTVNGGAK